MISVQKRVFQRVVKKNHKCLASSELCERKEWLYYFTLPSLPLNTLLAG
jgi:hypothetical protein